MNNVELFICLKEHKKWSDDQINTGIETFDRSDPDEDQFVSDKANEAVLDSAAIMRVMIMLKRDFL